MASEQTFQTKVKNWLKSKGCYVLVLSSGAGIPDGMTDILALVPGGGWIALECKKANPFKRDGTAKKGAFQPLQLPTIAKLNEMYYARATWPDNWDEVKKELELIL